MPARRPSGIVEKNAHARIRCHPIYRNMFLLLTSRPSIGAANHTLYPAKGFQPVKKIAEGQRREGDMKVMRIMIVIGMAMGILASPHALENRSAPASEREPLNDERMWQLMRLALVEFGYSNKVAALDAAWQKTMTPQQWATVDWSKSKPPSPTLAAQKLAARCAAATNTDFAAVIRLACRESTDPRVIATGLLAWTQGGGRPSLQGRNDLALHFIYAAVCELSGLGQAAAVIKEQLDRSHGKPFDLDDLAAGFAGAEWARQARQNPHWLQHWASGGKDLHKNLPALRYGIGPHPPEVLRQIHQDIQAALAGDRDSASRNSPPP